VISLVRVDNRLIHGQVVEAWVPRLRATRMVVADDEAFQSPLVRAAMGLAVPSLVEARIQPLMEVDYRALSEDLSRTLLLFRDLPGVLAARAKGLRLSHLNLGNIHYGPGRRKVSASVFLTQEELDQLKILVDQGVEVEARGVPTDAPLNFANMVDRFGKGA
jgi:PTS system mannose-specific IIB component